MLNKTKKTRILISAVIFVFLLSNMGLSVALQENSKQAQTSNENGLTVLDHKITSEELPEIKNLLASSAQETSIQNVGDHGTGYSSPTLDDLEDIAQNAYVVDSISYSGTNSSVDNSATPWFPPIGDQGMEGSCVAWAVGYYTKTFQEAKEHGWDLSGARWEGGTYGYPTVSYQDNIMSPDFIYSLINRGVDQGANFEDAINLVESIGVCTWTTMPYAPFDVISWPSEAAWTEASYYRSSGNPNYEYIYLNTEEGLLNLKNWLAAGNLAVFTIDGDQIGNLTNQDVLVSYDFSKWTDHANTIVGYDDNFNYTVNGEVHFGAFKIANSWGVGEWENVVDGFYWLPYEIIQKLATKEHPVIIFNDLTDYQPQLTTSFKIEHQFRGECTITIGYGTVGHPLATKSFSAVVLGGNRPFCSNNIVVDITEFKEKMVSLYNQPFFLSVYDNLTRTTGTVTYFAVEDSVSSNTPVQTRNYATVSLTVTHTLVTPSLTVSPSYGIAGQKITVQGTGFTAGNSVNLTYLNPAINTWITIANNIPVSQTYNFTYTFDAPDLGIGNPAGDHQQSFDNISFAASDNGNGYSFNSETAFTEYRKGLTVIGDASATGIFGNNTDLSDITLVQADQNLIVCGLNFNPGTITAVYDGTYSMGSAVVGDDGSFNATFTVPRQAAAGQHVISLGGSGGNFMFTVTQMPQILADYDGTWKSNNFGVTLSVDGDGVLEVYYKINNGQTRTIAIDGHPQFTSESADNSLEYWGTWSNGTSTIELTHRILSSIKLDKTAPAGSMQINEGAKFTSSSTVTLSLTCSDALSGVQKMRFSNDGTWDTESWESYSNSKSWSLISGDGTKTVYCQIMDAAGNTASFEASIVMDTTKPVVDLGDNRISTAGLSVDFAAECSDQNGIESIIWSFGDDATAEGSQVSHVFVDGGNYTVTVMVKDLAGNIAEESINVNVESILQSIPSGDVSENNPLEIPVGTALVILILFAVFGLSLIIIKYKRKILTHKN
ncbi:MAG: PKD domain-containing protein [Candidatus Bathyarchaeia archaeon]